VESPNHHPMASVSGLHSFIYKYGARRTARRVSSTVYGLLVDTSVYLLLGEPLEEQPSDSSGAVTFEHTQHLAGIEYSYPYSTSYGLVCKLTSTYFLY